MTEPRQNTGWIASVHSRAQLLHNELAAIERIVSETGGDETMLATLSEPIHEMLEGLRSEDLPLATLLEAAHDR